MPSASSVKLLRTYQHGEQMKMYIKAVAILLLFNSMAYYYDRNGHIQNDLRTARERNRRRGATCKLLFIKHLTKIRVVISATLKTLNILTHNQLRGARLFNGKYRQFCR